MGCHLMDGYMNNMNYTTMRFYYEWNAEAYGYYMHSFVFNFHSNEESLYYGKLKEWLFE
jgi:hypothetical protein